MKAEIVSIGTELLLGQITDTNAPYIASQLPLLGINLYWISQVGDNQSRVVEVLQRAWNRSDIIVTTGGLGPTQDDITRESIARMLNEELKVDTALEVEVRGFFAQRGVQMPLSNLKQATLIPSARAIINPRGTAPGWWVQKNGKLIIAIPGPPAEMRRMWEKEVVNRLREHVKGDVILSRTIKTLGLSEAAVDELLGPMLNDTNPTIGVYAKIDGIHLRMTVKAGSQKEARAILAAREKEVRELLKDKIWGTDDQNLEGLVGEMLTSRKLRIGVMESCTGGLLASILTDVPGSSAYFTGGVIAYANDVKVAWGVPEDLIASHGAISRETAGAMAGAIRERMGTDIGLSTTGVAGPDELEGNPVGLVYIGLDNGKNNKVTRLNLPPRRPDVKIRAAVAALFELRKMLLNEY
ncbi:MAG: competence/damage-inducible protein A [Dehalococcoidia bacterium]|nr:competence/damage-inducible protein A [Dehalococcoidia bacterium]MDZ4246009.1 competence/damage-inducible protein A [Dehalococcoidia bacterium]